MEDIEEFETSHDEEILEVTYPEEEKHLGEGGEGGEMEEGLVGHHTTGSPSDISKTIWEFNWVEGYKNCPEWKMPFNKTQGEGEEWPKRFVWNGKQLTKERKFCIPTSFQGRLWYDHHQFLGHVGYQMLWEHMGIRYEWGTPQGPKN